MATTSELIDVNGSARPDFQDTVVHTYEVKYDSPPTNFYSALIAAQGATGTPVPLRRSAYAGTSSARLYVTDISVGSKKDRVFWQWNVTFSPPPPGELNVFTIDNPLLRPPVYNVDYMEREYVIEKAKNVQQLTHGDGKGGDRPALTLGPIVNAAGKRPDEPHVETERLEVLVIQKNFPTLAAIVTQNRAFRRTTNSDVLVGYQARQLRYLICQSLGVQFENGVEFWPGVTTILAEETTDLILDNVGYDWWDNAASNWKRAVDKDNAPTAEPINLKLDGDKAGDNSTTITYRHFTETAYASLVA